MKNHNAECLYRYAIEKSQFAKKKAFEAINLLKAEGSVVTFSSVSKRAHVSRTFLYKNLEVRNAIDIQRKASENQSESSLKTLLQMQKVEIARLNEQIRHFSHLEEKLKQLEKQNEELKKQLRVAYKY